MVSYDNLQNNEIDDALIQSNLQDYFKELDKIDNHFIKTYLIACLMTISSTLNVMLFDEKAKDESINDFVPNINQLNKKNVSEIFKIIAMHIYISFLSNQDNIIYLNNLNLPPEQLLNCIEKFFNFNQINKNDFAFLLNERDISIKNDNISSYYIKFYRLIIQQFLKNPEINAFASLAFQTILNDNYKTVFYDILEKNL